MQIAFFAVLLALFSVGTTAQDSALKPDGRMWQSFGNSGSQATFVKAAYVQGAIEGLRVGAYTGYLEGRQEEYRDAFDNVKQCLKGPCAGVPIASLIKDPDSLLKDSMAGGDKERAKVSPQDASVLGIVHQMDKFYSDYRNTPVCMIVALQESIQSLQGKASTEAELRLMREQGCNQ